MIDQQLIDQNIHSLTASITCRQPVIGEHLTKIQNCYTQSITDKLQSYLQRPDLVWTSVNNQVQKSRRAINWDPESVIEELYCVSEGITDILSDLYSISLRFVGNQLWHDTEKYYLTWHKDNPTIAVAMQVYLFDTPAIFGTTFLEEETEKVHVIPFEHNTGYLANHNKNSYQHRTTNILPANSNRYSLYSMWELSN